MAGNELVTGGVEVGYPPRTPAQARVCAAPGDVPAPCSRSWVYYTVQGGIGLWCA
jgi:hypothetical protein